MHFLQFQGYVGMTWILSRSMLWYNSIKFDIMFMLRCDSLKFRLVLLSSKQIIYIHSMAKKSINFLANGLICLWETLAHPLVWSIDLSKLESQPPLQEITTMRISPPIYISQKKGNYLLKEWLMAPVVEQKFSSWGSLQQLAQRSAQTNADSQKHLLVSSRHWSAFFSV